MNYTKITQILKKAERVVVEEINETELFVTDGRAGFVLPKDKIVGTLIQLGVMDIKGEIMDPLKNLYKNYIQDVETTPAEATWIYINNYRFFTAGDKLISFDTKYLEVYEKDDVTYHLRDSMTALNSYLVIKEKKNEGDILGIVLPVRQSGPKGLDLNELFGKFAHMDIL